MYIFVYLPQRPMENQAVVSSPRITSGFPTLAACLLALSIITQYKEDTHCPPLKKLEDPFLLRTVYWVWVYFNNIFLHLLQNFFPSCPKHILSLRLSSKCTSASTRALNGQQALASSYSFLTSRKADPDLGMAVHPCNSFRTVSENGKSVEIKVSETR